MTNYHFSTMKLNITTDKRFSRYRLRYKEDLFIYFIVFEVGNVPRSNFFFTEEFEYLKFKKNIVKYLADFTLA